MLLSHMLLNGAHISRTIIIHVKQHQSSLKCVVIITNVRGVHTSHRPKSRLILFDRWLI